MSENKRRRSSSTGFWGRIRQSARHIENEAKEGARRVEHSAAEGARRVQHDAQERVRNMTPKQKNGWKKAGRIIGTLLLVFVLTASIFAGIFMAYINSAMRGKVEVYLDEFETQVSTELYYQDPDTQEWVMYQTLYMDENRIWVDLENIPKYLQKAAIAIEDKRFEKHHGVDWKGTTRAIVYTLFGKNVQGGSTITQQLVKNVTGDNQVTVKRKITEIYRALELEKRYEKDEILEAYLNEVYFGQRCSGVMTAARVYFGKDVSELSLAECASMMGITNNPSMYDPFISSWTRENNRERQLTILSEMLSQGKIDQEEYDAAVAEDIQFANGFTISGKYVGSDGTGTEPDTEDTTDTSDDTDSPTDDSTPTIKGSNSWFTDAMITDVALVEKLGITEKVNSEGKKVSAYDQAINMVYSKGYKIYTTQNPKYQKIAEAVCYNLENIPYTSSYTNSAGEQVEDQLQIALTIVDPTNGYVVAMIGGILLLSEIPSAGGTAGLGLIVWGSYLVLGADEGKFRFRILLRTDIRYRFAALFCTALEAVFLKKLILLSSTGQAFLANCWAGAVFCLLGTLLLPRGAVSPAVLLRPRGHAAMLILLALCFGAMQYATNTAFLLLPVGPALALFQLSAVVNLWLGWKLFHESGMRRKIAGTVLTVAGAVLIILFK